MRNYFQYRSNTRSCFRACQGGQLDKTFLAVTVNNCKILICDLLKWDLELDTI